MSHRPRRWDRRQRSTASMLGTLEPGRRVHGLRGPQPSSSRAREARPTSPTEGDRYLRRWKAIGTQLRVVAVILGLASTSFLYDAVAAPEQVGGRIGGTVAAGVCGALALLSWQARPALITGTPTWARRAALVAWAPLLVTPIAFGPFGYLACYWWAGRNPA